jgi:hypothetical protein
MGSYAECAVGFLVRVEDFAAASGELLSKAIRDCDGEPWAPDFSPDSQEEIDYGLLAEDIVTYLEKAEVAYAGDVRGGDGVSFVFYPKINSKADNPYGNNSPFCRSTNSYIKLSSIKKFQKQFDAIAEKLRSLGLPTEMVAHSIYHE